MSSGKKTAARLVSVIGEMLFPPRCLLCGCRLPAGESLCRDCAPKVPQKPWERRYGLEGRGDSGLLILSPLSYQGGCRKAVHRLKFRGKKALAKPFGRLMAQAAGGAGPFDVLTWVPMTERKRRERGYNQSRLLAQAVAAELGLPCEPLLEKVRETGVQHQLSRGERLENVKNAYRAQGAAGRSVLLVDDIVTTGATLAECAKALYRDGARRVVCLCAADNQGPQGQKEAG